MTTVVEAIMQAAQDLRDAVASVLGLRADMQALKDSTSTNVTQTINNFVNRAPTIAIFVDEGNGVDDANHGTSIDAPFKTIDYALSNTDSSVIRSFFLLSDVTLRKFVASYQAVRFVGIVRGAGQLGQGFAFTKRKFSFLPEALNSPRPGTGRGPAFLDLYGASTQFDYIDLKLPNTTADMNSNFVLATHGGSLTISNGSVDAEVSGVRSYLIEGFAIRLSFTFYNSTLGPNAPGHVLSAVAAGADPRTNFAYETNLASA